MPPGFGRAWPGVNETKPLLLGGYDAPVYVVDSRKACSRTFMDAHTVIYDLGQEMAGVPRIRFQERKEPALLSGMEKCSTRICRNMRQGKAA